MEEIVYMYGVTKSGELYSSSGVVVSDFKNTTNAFFYESETEFRYKCSKKEGEILYNRVWYRSPNAEEAMNRFIKHELKIIENLNKKLQTHRQKYFTLIKGGD